MTGVSYKFKILVTCDVVALLMSLHVRCEATA